MRRAIVTGGASGLGAATADRLRQSGLDVITVDLAETADEVVDITDGSAVRHLAQRVGPVDILINSAGIFKIQPFEDMTFADWRRTLSINLDSAFLTCSAFVPGMKRRGFGRIVNMASSTFFTGASGFSHYVASKGGLIGLTHVLATELGPHGITVNAIAPALTRTPGAMARGPRPGETDMEKSFTTAAARQAIPRVQVPADLVGTVSFLTSDDAAFITGQTLNVNGGLLRT